MGDKYIAFLLVCHVVVACVKAETFEQRRKGCYNYCTEACIYPRSFCKWWCHGRCKNPTLCGNLIFMDIVSLFSYLIFGNSLVEDNGPKEYPVPTKEDYNNYISTPPTSPSSKKNKVHPKLVAEDEPKLVAEDEPKLEAEDEPKSEAEDEPKSEAEDEPKSEAEDEPNHDL
ncbi:hypothetical protein V8G54_029915 [Vigna mungo]|uniref:Uncharacterized protein n=1 Tax=Vigna mungo TaxID=3915 RepID=A0AAQ3MU84_VIGMU